VSRTSGLRCIQRSLGRGVFVNTKQHGYFDAGGNVSPQPPTPPKPPAATNPTPSPDQSCDPNYAGACVPVVAYDLNCADIGAMVTVVGDDPNRFDADGDGYGCESYG
jgi:hypothetical protein